MVTGLRERVMLNNAEGDGGVSQANILGTNTLCRSKTKCKASEGVVFQG